MNISRILLILTLIGSFNLVQAQKSVFIVGADGSIIDEIEQSGGKFYDEGAEKEALEIFKKYGFNLIRLKLWHTPEDQYNSLPNVLQMAKRIKAAGLQFMLDFHYSDTWADPGHQYKPSDWEGLSFEILTDSIYAYTGHVISSLKGQNTLPEFVQVGNEISCGMLWNDGRICGEFANDMQWQKLGTLIKQAIQGIEDNLEKDDNVGIIIHFDNGANNTGCRWFFDNINKQNIPFDIIGLSFYPWWHGTLTALKNNLDDLAVRYNKDIMVVEAAYPWTLAWDDNSNNIVGSEDQLHEGYPATVEGQKAFIEEVLNIIKNTPSNRGKGYIYWAPEWIPGYPGSPWENLALFDFDGEKLESIKVFQEQSGIDNGIVFKPFELKSPYPVPFQKATTIDFTMKSREMAQLVIYDMIGNEISTIVDQELDAGNYSYQWIADDFAPGVYYVVFRSNGFEQVKKIILQ